MATKLSIRQQDDLIQGYHELIQTVILGAFGVKAGAIKRGYAAPCPPAPGTLPMFGMPVCQAVQYRKAAKLLVFPQHPDYAASVAETIRLLNRNNASDDITQMKGYAVAVQASEVLDNPKRVPYTQPAIIDATYPDGWWTKEQQFVWMTPGHPYGFPFILEDLYAALKAAVNNPPVSPPDE